MKIKDIIIKIADKVLAVIKFIINEMIPSDDLMKVTSPYTRQSFAENVRKHNSWD